MSDLTLQPATAPFSTTFAPPGSKSLTNRALVLGALAHGVTELSNVLFADDTLVMMDGLRRLGFWLDIHRDERRVHVHGRGGRIDTSSADLFCGNSGTTIRFLTALCSVGHGSYRLDGVARMRQRPIRQLVDLLRNMGVRINYLMEEGFAPIEVLADGLAGGIARFGAAQSSQFLSAVVQACPYARHEARIDLDPPQTSWPYVAMPMQLMDIFGITPELYRDPKTGEPRQVIVPRGVLRPTVYTIEPDASNAGYFMALAALHAGSKITIDGLGKSSLQGDVAFADVLKRMGAGVVFDKHSVAVTGTGRLRGIEQDFSAIPDTAQTMAVVALFADGPSILHGLHTLRVKETDRVAALATELRKLGADVEVQDDDLTIIPPSSLRPAAIDTYEDHRMAMSFALAATKSSCVTIRDAECVGKTYPGFFDDLQEVMASGGAGPTTLRRRG